ncbi:MAG: MCE family protein [Candidatus Mycalebacterium zealandia]|nr:MAG: MCE family protein [Candidatus Mycalebacterium zealandia]
MKKRDLQIGGFFLAGILAIMVVLEFAGSSSFLSGYRNLDVYFDSVSGLEEGSLVKMEGVRVGNVRSIGFSSDGGRIKVSVRVRKDIPLNTNTVATVRLSSLLGTSYVNLSLGSPQGRALASGESLDGKTPHDFDKIIQDAGEFLDEAAQAATRLNSILTKVDKGEGSVGKIINEEDLYEAAQEMIFKANTSLDTIEDLAPVSFIAAVLGVAGTFY